MNVNISTVTRSVARCLCNSELLVSLRLLIRLLYPSTVGRMSNISRILKPLYIVSFNVAFVCSFLLAIVFYIRWYFIHVNDQYSCSDNMEHVCKYSLYFTDLYFCFLRTKQTTVTYLYCAACNNGQRR